MASDADHLNDAGGETPPPKAGGKARHPLLGCLKGMVTIALGVDLTEPVCPEWADWIEEKYGNGRLCEE